MSRKFQFSIVLSVFLGLMISTVILPQAQAFRTTYYDLDLVDLKVADVQMLLMNDTPGYYLDDADLLKVTVNVTNNNLDYFVVQDKMFKIWVMEPDILKSTSENEVLEMVDNYDTSYDSELEVRYDDLPSHELFEECDYTNDRILVGESKTFTLCYDVLRIWQNEILTLDGKKKYFLAMTDNDKSTSCPNCKSVLLNEYYKNPITESEISDDKIHQNHLIWLNSLVIWLENSIISDQEFSNAIEFLTKRGIIEKSLNENNKVFLEPKIKNQSILAMVDFRQPRFNECQTIIFEGKLTDYSGNPISHVPILIRSDSPCPANQIIAQGITDKHGRYKIPAKALLWDEHDGLITTFAEFPGSESFQQSVSNPQLVVVYSVNREKCIG